MAKSIQVVQKDEGETLGVAGGNYRIVISGELTGGNYAVIEMIVPPGGGPPPHEHPFTQEMFYVLEGELQFRTRLGPVTVGKGGFVNIPFDGPVHCFKNVSGEFARLLCTVVPAGLENVFKEFGVPTGLGEFLPKPEHTEERESMLRQVDQKYQQRTYPPDFFESEL
jgi:quercetin dioxygenase-like cupin family protein